MRFVREPRRLQKLQRRLASRVRTEPLAGPIRRIAGVDVSYHRPGRQMVGGIVVLSWPDLEVVEVVTHTLSVCFPYVPGLLSFRELPVLHRAFRKLSSDVDLFLVDGQGIWHPRGFGVAAHFGLLVNRPTIGVAKSPLVRPEGMPGPRRGDVYMETRGAVVRTRTGVKPVYVSVGHRITLEEAVAWVLRLSRFRLPEPIRLADRLTREAARTLRIRP